MSRERTGDRRPPIAGLQAGFLVLNLALTLLIGAQSLHAVFQKPDFAPVTSWPDPAELKDDGPPQVVPPNPIRRADEISQRFVGRPVEDGDVTKSKKDEPPPPPAESGPLDRDWVLSMCLVVGDPQECYCVLERKASGEVRASIAPRGPRVPAQRAQTRPEMKMLKVGERWVDEELKIDIRVLDVSNGRLVYESGKGGHSGPFFLGKKPAAPMFLGGPRL